MALFWSLRMALSASASGVSMPTNTREELRLAHQFEDLGLLGDVERRLAGELQRVAVLLLPGDEVRKHVARGLAVADEVIVDEVNDRRMLLLPAHGVELGDDLLPAS